MLPTSPHGRLFADCFPLCFSFGCQVILCFVTIAKELGLKMFLVKGCIKLAFAVIVKNLAHLGLPCVSLCAVHDVLGYAKCLCSYR